MSEAAYTPAPWAATKPSSDYPWGRIRVAHKRYIEVEGRSADEARANVLLVAQAPAIADLLRRLVADCDNDYCPFCAVESWYGDGHSTACLTGEAITALDAIDARPAESGG